MLQIAGLMKLKASGVIEPDFKFKEGKKKVKKEDEEEKTYLDEMDPLEDLKEAREVVSKV